MLIAECQIPCEPLFSLRTTRMVPLRIPEWFDRRTPCELERRSSSSVLPLRSRIMFSGISSACREISSPTFDSCTRHVNSADCRIRKVQGVFACSSNTSCRSAPLITLTTFKEPCSDSSATQIVEARITQSAMTKVRSTPTVMAVIDHMDSIPRQRQEASLAGIHPVHAAFSISIRNTDGNRVLPCMLCIMPGMTVIQWHESET